jgi:hypothetical protein
MLGTVEKYSRYRIEKYSPDGLDDILWVYTKVAEIRFM